VKGKISHKSECAKTAQESASTIYCIVVFLSHNIWCEGGRVYTFGSRRQLRPNGGLQIIDIKRFTASELAIAMATGITHVFTMRILAFIMRTARAAGMQVKKDRESGPRVGVMHSPLLDWRVVLVCRERVVAADILWLNAVRLVASRKGRNRPPQLPYTYIFVHYLPWPTAAPDSSHLAVRAVPFVQSVEFSRSTGTRRASARVSDQLS